MERIFRKPRDFWDQYISLSDNERDALPRWHEPNDSDNLLAAMEGLDNSIIKVCEEDLEASDEDYQQYEYAEQMLTTLYPHEKVDKKYLYNLAKGHQEGRKIMQRHKAKDRASFVERIKRDGQKFMVSDGISVIQRQDIDKKSLDFYLVAQNDTGVVSNVNVGSISWGSGQILADYYLPGSISLYPHPRDNALTKSRSDFANMGEALTWIHTMIKQQIVSVEWDFFKFSKVPDDKK